MDRMYFLTNSIESADAIEKDLVFRGVNLNHIHIISHHDAEEKIHNVHSGSYFMRRDIVHSGERGLIIGLIVGLITGSLLAAIAPFAVGLELTLIASTTILSSLFGVWVGCMIGLSTENYKIAQFHDQLEADLDRHMLSDRQLLDMQASGLLLVDDDRHIINFDTDDFLLDLEALHAIAGQVGEFVVADLAIGAVRQVLQHGEFLRVNAG